MKSNQFLKMVRNISKNREKFGNWGLFLHNPLYGLIFKKILLQSEIFKNIHHNKIFVGYIVNFNIFNDLNNDIKKGKLSCQEYSMNFSSLEEYKTLPDIPNENVKTFLMLLNDYFYNCEKLNDKQKDHMNYIIFRNLQKLKIQ